MKLGRAKPPVYHKFLFFSIGLLVFVILCYIYIVIPQNQQIAELQVAYHEANQRNLLIQDFAKRNPETAQYLTEINNKAVQVDTMLPNQPYISEFIVQLEQTVTASKMQLIEVKAGQGMSKTNYQEIPIEIILQGSFGQMLDFLQKLENIPRFNIVNQINIQSQQGILNSKLNLSIYTYGAPSAAQGQMQGQQPVPKERLN